MKQAIYTTQFRRDVKKAKRVPRDLTIMKKVMTLLVQGKDLPVEYRDHKLVGNYKGRRECHLMPDFLLIYKLDKSSVVFERLGSHSELFD